MNRNKTTERVKQNARQGQTAHTNPALKKFIRKRIGTASDYFGKRIILVNVMNSNPPLSLQRKGSN